MGAMSREKGARGEREVAGMFRDAGFAVVRTPNSGGLHVPGDLVGLDGISVEVKRSERWDVPGWLRQTHEQAGDGELPVLIFRRNRTEINDPAGLWHVAIPLGAFLSMLAETLEP